LATNLERATDAWVASNPSSAWAWLHRVGSRRQAAEALLAHGQVTDAAAKLQEAITLSREAPRGAVTQWRTPFVWYDLATLAAQQGDRSAAGRALDDATRAWETLNVEMDATPFGRAVAEEYLEQFRRAVSWTFQEYAKVEHHGKGAVSRIDILTKRADLPPARKTEIDALHRAARMDVAKASLRLGRFSEAEQAAYEAATNPEGDGVHANLETNRAEAQAWHALAIARQRRLAEARSALAPALRVYRELQKNGAEGVDFDRALAFCLYVQAIACADDSAGRAERRAALEEAAQLLGRLSDEAKALRDVREMRELVDAERGKQKDKT
jgi:tetratricopeptide (TPR) repeat protein